MLRKGKGISQEVDLFQWEHQNTFSGLNIYPLTLILTRTRISAWYVILAGVRHPSFSHIRLDWKLSQSLAEMHMHYLLLYHVPGWTGCGNGLPSNRIKSMVLFDGVVHALMCMRDFASVNKLFYPHIIVLTYYFIARLFLATLLGTRAHCCVLQCFKFNGNVPS